MNSAEWNLLDTTGFVPRWNCGAWTAPHGWTHVASDLAIWAAYTAIPCVLIFFILRRRDVPFTPVFWLFGAFILACGTTHLIEAVIFWQPVYRLSAAVKVLTALVSWGTVVALIRVLPNAFALPGISKLNSALQVELRERQRRELDLSESRRFLRTTLDSLDNQIAILDATGRILATNAAWSQFGVHHERGRLGDNYLAICRNSPEGQEVAAGIEAVIHDRQPSYTREYVSSPPGGPQWFHLRITRFTDEGPTRVVVTHSDVTDRKQVELELDMARQAAEDANQTKSQFLANISHEIRTPMTAILGFVDRLADETNEQRRQEAVFLIKQNGTHLLQLVNDLLDIAKIEAGKLIVDRVACSPGDLAREVVDFMRLRAQEKSLDLGLAVAPGVWPSVVSDPVRIRQILINLVSNAVKFTDAGQVVLEVDAQREAKQDWLLFVVRDTGRGIDDTELGEIFKPFAQSTHNRARLTPGSGLGLAISQRLAQALGGSLGVQSRPGKGSTFTLRIPAVDAAREGVALREPAAAIRTTPVDQRPMLPRGCRILVAEDVPANRKLVSLMLNEAGAAVELAADGQEALAAIREASRMGRPFAAAILDIAMPHLDGLQVARLLREMDTATPLVALTAHAMPEDRQRCLAAGFQAYVTKPIDRHELIAVLLELVAPAVAPGRSASRSPAEPTNRSEGSD